MPRPKREGAEVRGTLAKSMGMMRIKYRIYARGDCWELRGAAKRTGGYSKVLDAGTCKWVQAHRATYELAKGPIPAGLHIDHICKHRWCVRPSHLEAVPQWLNNARSPRGLSEFCRRGHSMQDAYVNHRNPHQRKCRTCSKLRTALERQARGTRELKKYCGRGHSLHDARVNPLHPNDRQCRICANMRSSRYRERMRIKKLAPVSLGRE